MSNHLSGSKRLAVIQRWINGHDDPNWEVLPTRKEGKYIVKKRMTPIEEPQESPEELEETPESEVLEESPRKAKTPKVKVPKPKKVTESQDPTINLEILNQLKLLGEEMKLKREKKEQKRAIKEVVNKQIRQPKAYFPQEYIYQQTPNVIPQQPPPPEAQPQEQYTEPQPVDYQPLMFRRRNRIFEGI